MRVPALISTCSFFSVAMASHGARAPNEQVDSHHSITPVPAARTAGPKAPIGHTLRTPTAKRRLADLIAQEAQAHEGTGEEAHAFHDESLLSGIPRAFVSLGANEQSFGIIVEKLHHRLTVFRRDEQGAISRVKTYRAITGKKYGDKETRGDLKTPEGVYFATGKLAGNGLPAKYGAMAFTLDFPNIYDRQERKTGGGIWIHATDKPTRLLTPFDTEGCVALSNEDIGDLQQYITPFRTPVVITKEITVAEDAAETVRARDASLAMIEGWRAAWEASDFEAYSAYYSESFRSDGHTKSRWLKMKSTLSKMRDGDIRVRLSEPRIVAFEDQLLAVFSQEYEAPGKQDAGEKFLYLKWENDRYRIIAEKWYSKAKTTR